MCHLRILPNTEKQCQPYLWPEMVSTTRSRKARDKFVEMEAGYKRTLRHARAVVYSGRRCLYLIRCFDLHAYHLNLFLCTDAYMFAEQIRVQIDFNELLEYFKQSRRKEYRSRLYHNKEITRILGHIIYFRNYIYTSFL
ncbi:hypothetical protein RIR_jg5071.t1 [Rhizophagus irregularis DAOM 181602=DAOM 197198]|nr:hypothetical protein RIR_jg5071.t1 [Rhizophagus irregularis DAOM 181602=DAOM 197198]